MAIIAIGRMKVTSAVTALTKMMDPTDQGGADFAAAARWSLRQITGKDFPEPPVPEEKFGAGSLTPVD